MFGLFVVATDGYGKTPIINQSSDHAVVKIENVDPASSPIFTPALGGKEDLYRKGGVATEGGGDLDRRKRRGLNRRPQRKRRVGVLSG
jgi:hypothetical protein